MEPVRRRMLRCEAEEESMAVSLQRNTGLLVLGVWLVLNGIRGLALIGLPSPVMAVLALLAGVLILAGR